MNKKEYDEIYENILKDKPKIFKTELDKSIEKIKSYPKGFEFTINYSSIPTKAKQNGMMWILNSASKLGLIKCISTGLSIDDITGESGRPFTEETYKKI